MNNKYFTEERLGNDLNEIKKVFDTNLILKENFDNSKVQKYYKYSSYAYGLFHSKEGSVHMALNYDGIFNKAGYYGQANEINQLIGEKCNVLELGCGKGFNTSILAEKNKSSKFYGIDISKTQLRYAKKRMKSSANVEFIYGDFQHLNFEDDYFDVVFAVESVCYSENLDVLIREVNRVLKKGGKFIVYDAFKTSADEILNPELKDQMVVVGKAMAVNKFHEISDWINISQSNGFEITVSEDISEAVMPNLKRLYKASKLFLKNKILAKFILTLFPPYLIKNSIAGITMPYSIMLRTNRYNKIITTKN
jgi:ubiquinone/menaquinone biosynthesis C-methylase UbiE